MAAATALEVQFDVKELHLSDSQEQTLRQKLGSLARQVGNFPVAELRAVVQGSRSHDISIKLSLILPGKTLVARDHDEVLNAGFDRCIEFLVRELDAYKNDLGNQAKTAKTEEGTHHELRPSVAVDERAIDEAVRAADYVTFRNAMSPFEDELRLMVGRWVQRYPEVNDAVGDGIEIADIVEETLLEAFEQFPERPSNVPLGVWLQRRADSALKSIVRHPEDVLQNVSFIRTARNAPEGQHPE